MEHNQPGGGIEPVAEDIPPEALAVVGRVDPDPAAALIEIVHQVREPLLQLRLPDRTGLAQGGDPGLVGRWGGWPWPILLVHRPLATGVVEQFKEGGARRLIGGNQQGPGQPGQPADAEHRGSGDRQQEGAARLGVHGKRLSQRRRASAVWAAAAASMQSRQRSIPGGSQTSWVCLTRPSRQ